MTEDWKPLPLPDKDCCFQGELDCGRICCDSIGDDVSPEFCYYCRWASKVLKMKPCKFAEKLHKFLMDLEEEERENEKSDNKNL